MTIVYQQAKFAGIAFPTSRIKIRGGSDHYLHKFPHSAGADPEKLGRRLYEIELIASFHQIEDTDLERRFPGLYPDGLRGLMSVFEAEQTNDLVVPNLGTIKAFAIDWEREFDAKRSLSGEETVFKFLEDPVAAFAVKQVFTISVQRLASLNDELLAQTLKAESMREADLGFFQKINDAVTAVVGVLDLADVATNLVAGKIEALTALCTRADNEITMLQDPLNWIVVDALHNLWAAANDLAEDAQLKRSPIQKWIVPKVMTIGEVSTKLYGTTERGFELLKLNNIDDALAIPAGFVITYYADGATGTQQSQFAA